MINNKPSGPTIRQGTFVLLFVFIALYFLMRAVFIASAGYSPGDKILAILFLLSEAFVFFHAIGYFVSIYRRSREVNGSAKMPPLKSHPVVAILIPARHEPKAILENTLVSCYNLDYPNRIIYLLDDSSEQKYKDEARELAEKYGAFLFKREQRHGAKAGILNDCLNTLKNEEYVAVFDVDQNPMPNFLSCLVAILEANPKLALVQAPQFYSNTQSSRISFAAQMQQSVFYEYVCEGKSSHHAMICCGTNVVFRRKAIGEVGNFDESTVTEDFALSFRLHLKGWDTLYYNHVNTFGMGPTDIGTYLKQQNRWAMGNVKVLRNIIKNFLRSPFALKPVQWFEYFVTGTYYLVGWAYLFLVFCPVTYILFNIPSFFMHPVVYILTFLPYIIISLSIFYSSMQERRYNPKQMLMGQALLFLTLPVYMKASLLGLFGIQRPFQITFKKDKAHISYAKLLPQLAFWGVNLAVIAWGINRFMYEQTAAVMINIFWVAYHFIFLSSIFYFNET